MPHSSIRNGTTHNGLLGRRWGERHVHTRSNETAHLRHSWATLRNCRLHVVAGRPRPKGADRGHGGLGGEGARSPPLPLSSGAVLNAERRQEAGPLQQPSRRGRGLCSREKLISDARRLRGGGGGEDGPGVVVALPEATGRRRVLLFIQTSWFASWLRFNCDWK